jgi:DNA-binding response OmpR family regulator
MERKKKILIVDDEQAILKFLVIKFKISGYDVETALSGEQALEVFGESSPDILLLDILMPGMDGFTVLRNIRRHSRLPVIAFSARQENEQKAMELGANDFVCKPFNLDEMIKRVKRLVEQYQA